jgi:hypothetical protein
LTDKEAMKTTTYSALFLFTASISSASIVTSLSQDAGLGSNIDLTSGSYLSWGFATGSLNDGFDNFQSGSTTPAIAGTTSASTRDFGFTFTFNDGDSPTSGTSVASSGGQAGLLSGGPSLTFSNIVSSTETRQLTLYVGGWQSGGDQVDINYDATLTGGVTDESGTSQTMSVVDATTDSDGYRTGVYTVTFSSMTETDLVVDLSYSNVNGSRNSGISGYTLQVVPEPSSFALLAGMLGFTSVMLRRRRS